MIKKIILLAACFQAAVSVYAQTEKQKQMIYEQINRDSKMEGIIKKIDPIENKKALFRDAQVLPVFKIRMKKDFKPELIQNKNYYLVLYLQRLYVFMDNKTTRLVENNPVVTSILDFNSKKINYFVVYFTDTFSFNNQYLMPCLVDKDLSVVIDKGSSLSFESYIDKRYGSKDKYEEKLILDEKRQKLSVNEFDTAVNYNYEAYQTICSQDTLLVIKTMINQIGFAVKTLTKEQQEELTIRLNFKINPDKLLEEQLGNTLTAAKVKESDIKIALAQSRAENKKRVKENVKQTGLYSFNIYNVSTTEELIDILTSQQFSDYKNYIDLWYPIIETQNNYNNNKYRYNYGKDILEKQV
ncbi:hypothetical protein [Flavobacterium ginsengiterrae]|uniref:SPFH domain/Band 7 family protein n=1 Tax=Flavobacterium ginsengiterrae TaxID=871695 RepID=A0ABP7G371_9FLAO